MSIRILSTSVLIVFALAGCAQSEAERAAFAGATQLTAADIQSAIIGSTVSGRTANGNSWVEYYDQEGAIRRLFKGNQRYQGKWALDGDRMCWDMTDDQYDGCWGLRRNGDTIYFTKADGTQDGAPATLAAGRITKSSIDWSF